MARSETNTCLLKKTTSQCRVLQFRATSLTELTNFPKWGSSHLILAFGMNSGTLKIMILVGETNREIRRLLLTQILCSIRYLRVSSVTNTITALFICEAENIFSQLICSPTSPNTSSAVVPGSGVYLLWGDIILPLHHKNLENQLNRCKLSKQTPNSNVINWCFCLYLN